MPTPSRLTPGTVKRRLEMKTVLIFLLYSDVCWKPMSVPRNFDSHLEFSVKSLKAQPLDLETLFTDYVVYIKVKHFYLEIKCSD